MSRHKPPRKTVAVVGSGLAGLTTAYLLARDSKERYDVEVFEMVRNDMFVQSAPNADIGF
jgi:predicted NAD/FAD-binding protein